MFSNYNSMILKLIYNPYGSIIDSYIKNGQKMLIQNVKNQELKKK